MGWYAVSSARVVSLGQGKPAAVSEARIGMAYGFIMLIVARGEENDAKSGASELFHLVCFITVEDTCTQAGIDNETVSRG